MMREVTRYQTNDLKEFSTSAQAQRHADDILCQAVEAFLIGACPGFDRPSTYKAVKALVADKEVTIIRLQNILDAMTFGEQDD